MGVWPLVRYSKEVRMTFDVRNYKHVPREKAEQEASKLDAGSAHRVKQEEQ